MIRGVVLGGTLLFIQIYLYRCGIRVGSIRRLQQGGCEMRGVLLSGIQGAFCSLPADWAPGWEGGGG